MFWRVWEATCAIETAYERAGGEAALMDMGLVAGSEPDECPVRSQGDHHPAQYQGQHPGYHQEFHR